MGGWLAQLAIVAGPLLIGGMPAWAVLTLFGLWTAAASLLSHGGRGFVRGRAAVVVLGAFGLAAGWTALQGAPLPCGWLEGGRASLVEGMRASYALLGDGSRACSLTYDPGRTHTELLKALVACAACAAGVMMAGRGRRRAGLLAIAVAPLALAAATAAHWSVGAEQIWGFYTPRDLPSGARLSPIINANALAGFLAAHIPLLWAYWFRAGSTAWRSLWLAGALLCVALASTADSRGANGILLLGSVWCATRMFAGAGGSWWRRLARAAVPVLVVCVCVIVVFALSPGADEGVSLGGLGKLEIAVRTFELALRHPWWGVGRGGFAAAFAQSETARGRVYFAENMVAQYLAEWGLVLGAVILACWAAGWFLAWKEGGRSLLRRAALVGLGLAVLQNVVDLAFELPAVHTHWAFVFGLCAGQRLRRDVPTGSRSTAAVRWRGPAGWLAGAALFAWLLVPAVRSDVYDATAQIQAALDAGDVQWLDERVPVVLRAHPMEPNLILLGTDHMVRSHPREAGRWVNRALQAVPKWWQPHVLAARWLYLAGYRPQAMAEIATAAQKPDAPMPAVARVACSLQPPTELLMRALPEGERRNDFLAALASCLPGDGPSQRKVDHILLESDSGHLPSRYREASRRIGEGEVERALEVLAEVEREQPGLARTRVLRYQAWLWVGQPEKVVASCVDRREIDAGFEEHLMCARAFAKMDRVADMRAEVEELRQAAGGDYQRLSNVELRRGQLEESVGNERTALQAYERSHTLHDNVAALRSVERLAKRLRDLRRAQWAREELCAISQCP